MTIANRTPSRSSSTQRRPAIPLSLHLLLRELNIHPPGPTSYHLVSRWASKHVWRVDVGGQPWAYIRYLLGPASRFPERWRHLQLAELLYEASVGPRILGMTEESDALSGRAAIVEQALTPISRQTLEGRAEEAIDLLARLHSDGALLEALSYHLNENDLIAFSPLAELFDETGQRWFRAVTHRWQRAGLVEINRLIHVVKILFEHLDGLDKTGERIQIAVPAHRDPNHGNFMLDEQGALRLIDFEELALSNPVADLGVFLTWYVDRDRHYELLQRYPLAEPEAVLEQMQVWVPLRYLGIAAHWSARLTRARNVSAWAFAVSSIDEWLRAACQLAFDGLVPPDIDRILSQVTASLLARWP